MRLGRARVAAVATALTVSALASCSQDHGAASPRLSWRETRLPAPTGQRPLVRDATWCAGRWVVVGATADVRGRTRPAVWASPDARDWRLLRIRPGPDFYAAREVLSSVACSQGRLALLGAKPGGAHGIPRRATWWQRPDGSLAAVGASYLLFGGTESVAVARLVGGARGFLITGTRTGGAAVWQSPTGASFHLYDGAPGLASTSRARTQARDAMPYRSGWLLVGQVTEPSGRLRGVSWYGDRAGPWSRLDLPGGSTVSTAERLVRTPAGPETAGLLDQRFGLWALRGGAWSLVSTFGGRDEAGSSASYLSGLAYVAGPTGGGLVAATYSDGARFRLWLDGDVPMPVDVAVDGDRTATVAAHGGQLLLLTDDDHAGRVWLTTVTRPDH